jgi:simple sugar transport system ATP-binding protein
MTGRETMFAPGGGHETVRLEHIWKSFGSVVAVRDVTIALEPAEIHAVLGENGAGKTTLMNVLYGAIRPDAGRILVRGNDVTHEWSTRKAIESGIGMIHQHFSLIPNHTVLENVVMPRLRWQKLSVNWKSCRETVETLSAQYGFHLPMDSRVEDLAVGQRQQVEILKLLYQNATVLILDEPTSVLTPQQTSALLAVLQQLRVKGYTIVLITHKLGEVLAISTRITVLRQGMHVVTVTRSEATGPDLARMMVDREWSPSEKKRTVPPSNAEVALRVRDLVVEDASARVAVNGISLEVRAGEIVGVAGVAGNGQTELAEAIVGYRPTTHGSIQIGDVDVTNETLADRRRMGVCFIPEDRYVHGAVREMTVAENLILDRVDDLPFSLRGVLRPDAIRTWAWEMLAEYDIRAQGPEAPSGALSGGNLQKVVLARALSANPRVIVASEPTRGLDISAAEYVREKLLEAASNGIAVLVFSSDLDELLDLCHRVTVMFRGRIVGDLAHEQFDLQRIGLLMAGHADDGGQPAKASDTVT